MIAMLPGLAAAVFALSPPDQARILHFGGPRGEVGTDVTVIGDGAYIVVGYEYHDDSNDWKALRLRVDENGKEAWRTTVDGPGLDYYWSIERLEDDVYVAAGVTSKDAAGETDILLEQFDAAGNIRWQRRLGTSGSDQAWSLETTPDGGFVVVGQTDGAGAGGLDFYLVRTDDAGEVQWSRTFGGPDTDRAFAVARTDDGGFVLGGFSGKNRDAMDFLVVRTDDRGDEVWRWRFGGDGFDVVHDLTMLPGGDILVVGYTSSFGRGGHDGCLIRLSAEGRLVWMQTIGGPGDDRILHVAHADQGFVLCGYRHDQTHNDWNALVVGVNRHGGLTWERTFGGAGLDQAKAIHRLVDGSFLVVGGTQSFGNGLDDLLLIRIPAEGLKVTQ